MFSFRTTPLFEQPDLVLKEGRLGMLCNQVAWHPDKGEYHFEAIARERNLVRLFMPEHSLYGECCPGVEMIEIGDSVPVEKLQDIDALIIELQDVGSRYCTFTRTLLNLFYDLHRSDSDISIYVIDKINSSGRQVEGTMGVMGLPHRHGLTFGEIANFFYYELSAKFHLHIISAEAEQVNKDLMPWSIPPFSDFAGLFTSHFYSGQCLWMGTNVSYGHGTTRPFEQFGAPFMEPLYDFNREKGYKNWNDPSNPLYDDSLYIRWCRFEPAYGIWKDEVCFGFHLMFIPGHTYHALNHALRLIRFVREQFPEEFEYNGLEQLLQDNMLFSYITGEIDWELTSEHIKTEEQKWLRKVKKYLLYGDSPWRVK